MISRTLLAAVSVLALTLASAAWADDNFTNVEQNGSDNDGLVTQGPGDQNRFGTESDAALQHGSDNVLDILQQGNDNAIGTAGSGFDQSGNRNSADITQTSNDNVIGQVQQVDETGNSFRLRNSLTITQQGGDGNTIGAASQTREAGLFSLFADGNSAAVTQGGSSSGSANSITLLSQSGRANDATVMQQTSRNSVTKIVQDGSDNSGGLVQRGGNDNQVGTFSQDGNSNSASFTFDGAKNGHAAFAPAILDVTAFAGLVQSNITQTGRANHIDGFTVTGSDNAFGFLQHNLLLGNTIDGFVTGDANQFGVYQDGEFNSAHIGIGIGNLNEISIRQAGPDVFGVSVAADNFASVMIGGDSNGVALHQSGGWNESAVTVDGNTNLVGATQSGTLNAFSSAVTGDSNTITLDQTSLGAGNLAQVSVFGNTNFADITQDTPLFGSRNSLVLDIHGNSNNAPSLGGFTGAALTAGLVPGTITQSGSGNSIQMSVGSASQPDSNANLFALSQSGSDNVITGTTIGSGNQVAVIQAGNGNLAAFMQLGSNNVIGISQ